MIGNYKILKKLGVGKFASAYLVSKETESSNDSQQNNLYVIKQISTFGSTQEEIKTFKVEANLLSEIKSNYVVKFFDSFEENDNLNIVMEYCDGGDLEQFLNDKKKYPLDEDFIWKIFIQIAIGLTAIHKLKILHRDLKSQNIFLTKDLNVKIGDLGVSKKLIKSNFAKTIIGTPYYLSPEICEEKPYNEKNDIWALGCILYELCTFHHPFESNSYGGLITKILNGYPESINIKYSANLQKIINLMLKKNFHHRPSCKAILKTTHIKEKIRKFGFLKDYHSAIDIKIGDKKLNLPKNNKSNKKITKFNKNDNPFKNDNKNIINKKIKKIKIKNNNREDNILIKDKKKDNDKNKNTKIKNNLANTLFQLNTLLCNYYNNTNSKDSKNLEYIRDITTKFNEYISNSVNNNIINKNINLIQDELQNKEKTVVLNRDNNIDQNEIKDLNNKNNSFGKKEHDNILNFKVEDIRQSNLGIGSLNELLNEFDNIRNTLIKENSKMNNKNNLKNDNNNNNLQECKNDKSPFENQNEINKNLDNIRNSIIQITNLKDKDNNVSESDDEKNKNNNNNEDESDSGEENVKVIENNEEDKTSLGDDDNNCNTKDEKDKEKEKQKIFEEKKILNERLEVIKKEMKDLIGEKDYKYLMELFNMIENNKYDEKYVKIEKYAQNYDEEKRDKFNIIYVSYISITSLLQQKNLELQKLFLNDF